MQTHPIDFLCSAAGVEHSALFNSISCFGSSLFFIFSIFICFVCFFFYLLLFICCFWWWSYTWFDLFNIINIYIFIYVNVYVHVSLSMWEGKDDIIKIETWILGCPTTIFYPLGYVEHSYILSISLTCLIIYCWWSVPLPKT